jgi:hypothetical protein
MVDAVVDQGFILKSLLKKTEKNTVFGKEHFLKDVHNYDDF